MLALDILDELAHEKIVSLSAELGTGGHREVSGRVESGIDGPRYAHELYSLSRLLELLGQPDQALNRVQEGLKISGGDLDGLCLAGRYAGKLGKTQAATEFYAQALAKQPGAGFAEEGLGGLLLGQGKLKEALVHLEAAARSGPESASLLNRMGAAHAQLGQLDQAVSLFRRAVRLSPKDPMILKNLALAEERRGNLAEAIVQYREAVRLKPDDAQAASSLQRLVGANPGPRLRN